jgi:hypothetical protein
MKPKLKPPGTKLLKLNCDILPSTSAFKLKFRRYTKADWGMVHPTSQFMRHWVRRCRLTPSNPS